MIKTISAGLAEDLAYRDDSSVVNGWRKLADQEIRESRWGSYMWLVLGDESQPPIQTAWGLQYFRGATEMQEHEMPWRGVPEDTQLPLTRLYAATRIIVEYSDRKPSGRL